MKTSPPLPPLSKGLAIDTSFDDTALALLSGQWEGNGVANLTLHAECVKSHYQSHQDFGGIVPEKAAREHLNIIHMQVKSLMEEACTSWNDLDWIGVTYMPGLVGSLLIGLSVAKALCFALNKPLIGINHVEAHPYACFLSGDRFCYPVIHLIIAGGHTLLVLQSTSEEWEIIGRTRDDAAGECVDKIARLYDIPMPGGLHVDTIARTEKTGAHTFPMPFLKSPHLDFSFSGLKSSLQRFALAHPDAPQGAVLADFMNSVKTVLLEKTCRAVKKHHARMVTLSGGLAASTLLREAFAQRLQSENCLFICPEKKYCTDNAAMIGILALRDFAQKHFRPLTLRAQPNLAASKA